MMYAAQAVCDVKASAPGILEQILEGGYIYPVYQPIVSLRDGTVFGYEALSRISRADLKLDIEEMFRMADQVNKSWELETLCRRKALEHSVGIARDRNLFLNVNSNIFYDSKFRAGFTKKKLKQYGLNADNIVFEITERVCVVDKRAFLGSVHHYKNQSYRIAIDDVGSGYSGLNIIADVNPNMIKLDMELIRNIDRDKIKKLLCKAMVDFAGDAGILLIAEGIETEGELNALIQLGVKLGQGYFLGTPKETFCDVAPEKVNMIHSLRNAYLMENQ